MSTATASAPASNIASALSTPFSPVPVAATTRSLPLSSLQDNGLSRDLLMSLTVIRPENPPSSSTTTSFSILWWCRSFLASSMSTCSGTVTRSVVITSDTSVPGSSTNLMSLLVTIPTMLPSPAITGKPEKPYWSFRERSSPTVISGSTVTGSRTSPDSNLLTLSTSTACSSIGMFLCITPMPPLWAMAIAISASVTVSIAADTIGALSVIPVVSLVDKSTSAGSTADSAGRSRTSS